MTSFERSVLIPYAVYQRCRVDKDEDVDILLDKTIPSDKKLKLYHQSILQSKTPPPPPPAASSRAVDDTLDYILHNIPDKDKPQARAILDIIKANPFEVNWSNNAELVLDNNIVPGSNLINLLLYFTKNLPITRGGDVPVGTRELYRKLLTLGMPASWVKAKPPAAPRTTEIRKRRKIVEDDDAELDEDVDVIPRSNKWSSLAKKPKKDG